MSNSIELVTPNLKWSTIQSKWALDKYNNFKKQKLVKYLQKQLIVHYRNKGNRIANIQAAETTGCSNRNRHPTKSYDKTWPTKSKLVPMAALIA
ncbi:23670_t:CDS:2 [Gigaspora rosea]|nr:23670_t:CDS:2 [Gigaspora rosea]